MCIFKKVVKFFSRFFFPQLPHRVVVATSSQCILIATFAMLTIYRLSFAISAVFVVVSIHQLISPDRLEEVEVEAEADD